MAWSKSDVSAEIKAKCLLAIYHIFMILARSAYDDDVA